MAIKMVREPSETPNINNVDDIIPMRYAYGGQNGYVIGKGTEISNTVNGSSFIINSGRLVLQGVECDIDATGVTISIDNIATKRYYSIYLQVNLATNNVSIGNTYDTADYPVIDSGDDLTENSSGIARMVLYKFTAQNGVISEVNKVVESIKYTPNMSVDNSKKINDVEIKKNNAKLIVDSDYTLPYKKLLSDQIIDLPKSLYDLVVIYQEEESLINRTFEIEISRYDKNAIVGNTFLKFKVPVSAYYPIWLTTDDSGSDITQVISCIAIGYDSNQNTISCSNLTLRDLPGFLAIGIDDIKISKIYEIFE